MKTQSKPTFPGCRANSSTGHIKNNPWTCRECGVKACASCARYHWVSKAGSVKAEAGVFVNVGERVGTCQKCSFKS